MTEKRAPSPPVTYSCGGCANRWTGVSKAHCAGCHQTWGTARGFDMHRLDVRGAGTCLNPAEMRTKAGEPIFTLDPAGVWRRAGEFDRTTYELEQTG